MNRPGLGRRGPSGDIIAHGLPSFAVQSNLLQKTLPRPTRGFARPAQLPGPGLAMNTIILKSLGGRAE
jgi:hypothetical protein